jgi:AraC-like DNA-binding protein
MHNNHKYSIYVRNTVATLKQLIEKNPLKFKNSSDLLEKSTTLNRRILEKAFKSAYGYRIKEYQVRQRLLLSKAYLTEGMPIKRVAAKCFYRSHSAFCRAFKRQFKITPTGFMKNGNESGS